MSAEPERTVPNYKLILAGEMGVGKSSLWLRYKNGYCPGDIRSTIGIDVESKEMAVPGTDGKEQVTLQLWDTGGQESRYDGMTKNYYHGAGAVIFVFSVENKNSLNNLMSWVKDAMDYAQNPACFFLCNKVDLQDEDHQVYQMDIQNFFTTCGNTFEQLKDADKDRLFYTSAKDDRNTGLDDALFSIIKRLHSRGRDPTADVVKVAEAEKANSASSCSC